MSKPLELSAAYERIDELEGALKTVRSFLRGDDIDPFEVIDRSVDVIDHAIEEKVVAG